MSSEWPHVTAIVNTCTRPHLLLPRALDSVLAQSFADFEVIVVSDGDPDAATVAACEAYAAHFAARDVLLTLLCSEHSGYQCVPKNCATYAARGDYIAYLDDDNEWTHDHLEVLVAAIEEGDVWPDLVYGRREYVLDEGCARTTKEGVVLPVGASAYVPWGEYATQTIAAGPLTNMIDTSDALIARGALWRLHHETGCMWNEETRRFADWELFCRGIHFASWRPKSIDKVVQRYHWHGANVQLTRPVHDTPGVEVLK